MLLTYNNIVNTCIIDYVRKVFLNLKCVLNVLLMLYGGPKFLPRLDELNQQCTETAKQPLRMEHEGLSSP